MVIHAALAAWRNLANDRLEAAMQMKRVADQLSMSCHLAAARRLCGAMRLRARSQQRLMASALLGLAISCIDREADVNKGAQDAVGVLKRLTIATFSAWHGLTLAGGRRRCRLLASGMRMLADNRVRELKVRHVSDRGGWILLAQCLAAISLYMRCVF